MKEERISLEAWKSLLAAVLAQVESVRPPAPMLSYLRDRLLGLEDSDWRPYNNGWRNAQFDEWDKRSTLYAKSIPASAKPEVAVGALEASWRLEMDSQTEGSDLHRAVSGVLAPLENSHSRFGLMSSRNDAVGELLHAMARFDVALLRGRMALGVDQVRAIAQCTAEMARFRTRNRLGAEYYPFTPVLRQLANQGADHLAGARKELEALLEAVQALPVDSADSMRVRKSQVDLASEAVARAQG